MHSSAPPLPLQVYINLYQQWRTTSLSLSEKHMLRLNRHALGPSTLGFLKVMGGETLIFGIRLP